MFSHWIGRLSFIPRSVMPRSSRKSAYRLRHHEIDPSLTYEGIANNPLPYVNSHPSAHLHLAELVNEHWTVDRTRETISLRDPFRHVDPEEKEYHKELVHPLQWFYQLFQTDQLSLGYSLDSSKFTVIYSFRPGFNLFSFYANCQKSDCFHQLFTFDDYQPIVDENKADAMNMIDFIYREIEARTMIENHGDEKKKIAVERFLRNEVIRLKEHQIKSIEWMLKRETEDETSIVYSSLHRCHDLADRSFYVHIISGLVSETFDRSVSPKEHLSLTGGILCDEMGLGKTLCVLLTSLLNPCPLPRTAFNAPPTKRVKADPSVSLPCLCGEIVTDENNAFVCHQCSRAVHRQCFLQSSDEELNEYFLCPYCEQRSSTRQALLSTGTTLIIVPASIIDQWIEEIDKHLDCSLRIFMYQGVVNKYPVPSRAFLAEQDFLFCSYENLRKDIHHNELCSKEPYSTRTAQRKYEYLVSPLLQLHFWRLVLDEAQMVDSPNTPTSKMARSVVSHHRWFVTGTPFHRSINDVEGIVQYLFPTTKIPRDQMSLLLRQKEKIHHVFLSWLMYFLQSISRRTSRKCLNDLPEQQERIIRLQFSPLERIYYQRIWKQSRDDFRQAFEHQNNLLNDSSDIHSLSSAARGCLQTPLMKLRCVCDHPQVGAHGVRHNDPALVHYYNRFHYSSTKRLPIRRPNMTLETNPSLMKDDQPFTMKDLLDLLTARELESGEDSLRLALLNFNGLASIYLIQHEHEQTRPTAENNNEQENNYLQLAVSTYEKVVEISRMYQVDFHVDSFQLAHAYFNLSYALTFSDPPLTSRWTSEEGRKEFEQIKQRYQTQSIEEMNETWKKYNEKLLPAKEFEKESNDLLSDLSDSIKSVENEQIDLSYYLNRDQQLPFSNWSGFLYHLAQQFDQLKRIREMLLLAVENLQRQPTDEQTGQMAACAKCGFDNDASNENSCLFCEIEPTFKSYHCSLQPELYSAKQIHDDHGSHLVYYINEILSKASMRGNDSTRQLAKILRTEWSELLKKLRQENSAARNYAQQLKHLYLSLDEMLQCTSRLEFFVGDRQDRPRNLHNRYRFYAESIDGERADFLQQAEHFLQQVAKHRQQFHYFQEQQQDYYRSIGTNDFASNQRTKCPMCHEYFGDDRPNVCFFLCGHFFCQQCTLRWKEHEVQQRAHRTHLKCPICRREIPIHSLTVLQWRDENSSSSASSTVVESVTSDVSSPRLRRLMETQEHLAIQGRYGTKVDSIVSFILELINTDIQSGDNTTATTMCTSKPPLKILVFSQFTDVLSVLAISLRLNAISFLQLTSTKILHQFRQDPSVTVLLMALGKGANGLNLTEAQHVILVEPQLHRSVGLQAIARVRRLGQRYKTFVYRFIINETVEEVVLADSRTAQTRSTDEQSSSVAMENASLTHRAASFADYELLYEINMARKIFYHSVPISEPVEPSLFAV